MGPRSTLAVASAVLAWTLHAAAPGGAAQPAEVTSAAVPGVRSLDRPESEISLEAALPEGIALVVFWRVDSKPSREAVIHLHQQGPRVRERGAHLVGITVSEPSAAREFLRAQNVGFPNYHDPGGRLAVRYGLGSVYPSLLLLDKDCRAMGKAEGGGDSFEAHLSRLLGLAEEAGDKKGRERRWDRLAAVVLLGILVLGLAIGR